MLVVNAETSSGVMGGRFVLVVGFGGVKTIWKYCESTRRDQGEYERERQFGKTRKRVIEQHRGRRRNECCVRVAQVELHLQLNERQKCVLRVKKTGTHTITPIVSELYVRKLRADAPRSIEWTRVGP